MSTNYHSNNKRIVKNTAFLYIRMLLLMVISLFTSRVLLDKLGIEDYGVYNVIGGMTAMFTFFSSSLANATQRFLNVELGKNCIEKAKLVFQQHLTLYLLLALIVFIIAEPIGIWLIKNKLVIPEERITDAILVFQFTLLSLCSVFIGIVFNSEIVSHEDMKIYSYVGVAEGILKLVICYLISITEERRLLLYGLLIMLITFAVQIVYFLHCIKHYEECEVKLIWNKKLLKETTGIMGWNLFGTVVWMVNDNLLNLLLNMFFGPVVNAARAISYQINAALNNFTNNFYMAVRPQLMKNFSSGNIDYLKRLLYDSTRFSLYLLLIIGLPVIICIEEILSLWLKEVPNYTSSFSVLIICYSFICVAHSPLWDVCLASGKIKKYQIIGGLIFIMVFPISYILLKNGFPPSCVFYTMIIVRLIYYCVSIIIVSKIIGFTVYSYIRGIFGNILPVIVTVLPIVFFVNHHLPNSINFLFLRLFIPFIIIVGIIYALGINRNERIFLNKTMSKIKRKIWTT